MKFDESRAKQEGENRREGRREAFRIRLATGGSSLFN